MHACRDTAPAKIFRSKVDHDFRESKYVTLTAKRCGWAVIVLLNVIFIYFSLLRALQRGQKWQTMYLTACIFQLVAEILFYETSECVLLHYIIPALAQNEVRSVRYVVLTAIQNIWSAAPPDNLILDAPKYLYVSTSLANKFRDLLESVIIQSYHSYSPGELAKKWRGPGYLLLTSPEPSLWSSARSSARRVTLSALTISFMQTVGAMSPTIQRVMIHTLQPLVLAALVFFGQLVYTTNPLYFIGFAFALGLLLYYQAKELRVLLELENTSADVHPVHDVNKNSIDASPAIHDCALSASAIVLSAAEQKRGAETKAHPEEEKGSDEDDDIDCRFDVDVYCQDLSPCNSSQSFDEDSNNMVSRADHSSDQQRVPLESSESALSSSLGQIPGQHMRDRLESGDSALSSVLEMDRHRLSPFYVSSHSSLSDNKDMFELSGDEKESEGPSETEPREHVSDDSYDDSLHNDNESLADASWQDRRDSDQVHDDCMSHEGDGDCQTQE